MAPLDEARDEGVCCWNQGVVVRRREENSILQELRWNGKVCCECLREWAMPSCSAWLVRLYQLRVPSCLATQHVPVYGHVPGSLKPHKTKATKDET